MKIAIISDIHDNFDSLDILRELLPRYNPEMIFNCGDWACPFTIEYFDHIFKDLQLPIKSVFGNNEGDIKRFLERNANLLNPIEFAPKSVFDLEIDNKKMAIYHGHDKFVLQSLIQSNIYKVVFHGHTHDERNEIIDKTRVINPGTLSFTAHSRHKSYSTFAIYDSNSNSAEIIKIDK